MHPISKCFASSFPCRAPLINRQGSAAELPGMSGFKNGGFHACLASQLAIKLVFLAVAGLAGPYVLQCFGNFPGILQLAGGVVLVGLGAGILHKKEALKHDAPKKIVESTIDGAARPDGTSVLFPYVARHDGLMYCEGGADHPSTGESVRFGGDNVMPVAHESVDSGVLRTHALVCEGRLAVWPDASD